ncbi:MAG: cytochrome c oxidase subunit 3 family protein [Deltaproteobacteria bacterium]|nr:MAG: cytochrome c oxidase subunit 3 family protein [Deltaproteobacteria bacterium]
MSTAHAHGGHHHPFHAHHFETLPQQEASARMGMWLFLGQELLFFSAVFVAFFVFQYMYPEGFLEAHRTLSIPLGTLNTLVLLTSSLTMALAVRNAQLGDNKGVVKQLGFTIALATVFMIVKYFEYSGKIEKGQLPGQWYTYEGLPEGASIFFTMYFVMTGLHGLHIVIGIGVLAWILIRATKNQFSAEYYAPVENVGLYWHLVDLIWIFLFPFLYLIE